MGTELVVEHEINGNQVAIYETTGAKHTWYDIIVDGVIINDSSSIYLDHVPSREELVEILAESIRDEEPGEQ